MSATDDESGVELSALIERVRFELGAAMGAGEGQRLRFVPESVELELKVSVRREAKGRGGIKVWVVEAGGEAARQRAQEQTIKLKLLPRDLSEPPGASRARDASPGRTVLISKERSRKRK